MRCSPCVAELYSYHPSGKFPEDDLQALTYDDRHRYKAPMNSTTPNCTTLQFGNWNHGNARALKILLTLVTTLEDPH